MVRISLQTLWGKSEEEPRSNPVIGNAAIGCLLTLSTGLFVVAREDERNPSGTWVTQEIQLQCYGKVVGKAFFSTV